MAGNRRILRIAMEWMNESMNEWINECH
jgi:hypothetical protein